MHRDRSTRKTFTGRSIPRRPVFPRMLRRNRTGTAGTRRSSLPRFASLLLVVLLIGVLLSTAVVGSSAFASYSQITASLAPRLETIEQRETFQTSKIYDRNGVLLYEFFDAGKRTKISLDDVSPLVIQATIAIEDKTFFTNTGVDYEGILRAVYQNVSAGAETSGASTITQQVIKNIVLTEEERSYENRYQRKMTEIILAQELNERYNKEQILELYLNEIYYGNLAYGIEAASDVYFDKRAEALSLAQASLLAGLPQLPSRYDPMLFAVRDERGSYLPGMVLEAGWQDPDYPLPADTPPPKWRQVAVLRQMVDEGYVSEAQARRAAAADLRFAPQEVPINAPHFVFYVRRLLEERYGQQLVTSGGLEIHTTLDLELQRMVQQKAADHIAELEARNIHNAAVVVMQPHTGQILAMVGSIDYNAVKTTTTPDQEGNVLDGQVNVTVRERQPGSALKPFTYLSAMEQGMTPEDILWDVPTEFPISSSGAGEWYAPENYNERWNGPVRIRTALANSLNMPAVKALRFAGIPHTMDLLDRVGIKTGLNRGADFYGLSLTLGGGEVSPLELTTAYNTLASGGSYHPPQPIKRLEYNDGTMLEAFEQNPGQQAVDPGLVSIISDMLSDDEAREAIWGLNSPLKLSQPAAVKTGTTNDWRDAWTLGYSPFVTVGVWSGNNNNEPTERVESLQGGGIIWRNVMEEIFDWIDTRPAYQTLFAAPFADGVIPVAFPDPADSGVVERPICELPGKFGGYDSELFTQAMLSGDDGTANGAGARCNAFERIQVVRIPGSAEVIETTNEDGETETETETETRTTAAGYCLPRAGGSYPRGWIISVVVWNVPPPDPDVRVQYRWSGGGVSNFSRGSIPVCPRGLTAPRPTAVPSTPTPTPEPAPFAGAVQMPYLVGYGENQARDALARLGITNVVVDYQTRERIPELFDQFGPYVVLSTVPSPGQWVAPGGQVILGIRSPEETFSAPPVEEEAPPAPPPPPAEEPPPPPPPPPPAEEPPPPPPPPPPAEEPRPIAPTIQPVPAVPNPSRNPPVDQPPAVEQPVVIP